MLKTLYRTFVVAAIHMPVSDKKIHVGLGSKYQFYSPWSTFYTYLDHIAYRIEVYRSDEVVNA